MSHETHHEGPKGEAQSKTSFRASFWLIVILVGLFIAAINFVEIMSSEGEEGGHHGEGAKTEEVSKAHEGEKAEHATGTPGETEHAAADTVHAEHH